jgi:hypothetical protein
MSDAAQISISKATQKFSLGATYEWSQSSYCDVKFHTQELMPLLVIRGGKSGFAVGSVHPIGARTPNCLESNSTETSPI